MFKRVQKLDAASQLRAQHPIDKKKKQRIDADIKEILSAKDGRKIFIAGPCSLDESGAIFEYLEKIRRLQERVADKLLIVVRLYTAKPRSRGGYVGLVHQQDGLKKCRQILASAVNDFELGAADELLYPQLHEYFFDAVSYFAVGTRSCMNQEHRFFASGVDVPVGFKNPVNGDLGALADAIAVCSERNTLFDRGFEVATSGNRLAHGILRGFSDHCGTKKSNYDAESVKRFCDECAIRGLSDAGLLIDFSHDNSGKDCARQLDAARAVAADVAAFAQYRRCVKGFMAESYLHEGKGDGYGYSRTDGCLSFEQTEQLAQILCEKL